MRFPEKVLADAIRSTNITNDANVGPGISFNASGQTAKSGALHSKPVAASW
jgi:hypothetical protein